MASIKVAPLLNPDDDPEYFNNYTDAETAAILHSSDDVLWGVWDEGGEHLHAIAYKLDIYIEYWEQR